MERADSEFFALIGEGAGILKGLDENSPDFFDGLNRLREIIAMIGEKPAPASLQFPLDSPDESTNWLAAYLDGGINELPDVLIPFEAVVVASLAGGIMSLASNEIMRRAETYGTIVNSGDAQIAVTDEVVSHAVKHGIDQDVLADAASKADALLKEGLNENPAYVAAYAEYERITKERREKMRELADKWHSVHAIAEQTAIQSERDAYSRESGDRQTEAWLVVNAATNAFKEGRVKRHAALFEENGKKIIAAVLAASPVTQEESDKWAAEQIIDDKAKSKLKKLGYKPDDVIRDMAEYYRLSGGKASAIRLSTDGSRRANAVGIEQRKGEKIINLGSSFNKTVLFHELAHHLENDPIAKAASNGFLLKRRESQTVYRLRDLTGHNGYGPREVAYKDGFIDPYVGKVYSDGITEVFSVGVQYLANPKDAAIFAAKDPHHYELITGYLSMPLTPAMRAKLDMHKGAVDELVEQRQTEEDQYGEALDLLAGKVNFAADDWYSTLDPASELYGVLHRYILSRNRGKDAAKYVGSSGEYRVFSGTFRNRSTKRNAKGFLVINLNIGGRGRNAIPDNEAVPGDIKHAKAMIAISEHDSTSLSSVWFNYFMDSSLTNKKQKLIEMVGAENLK